MVTPRRDDPAGRDALTEATVEWLVFGGSPRPRGFPLEHRVCTLFWSVEMWCWSAEQLAEKYRRHQRAVDALAVAAGRRPWCLEAIDRERP